MEGTKRNCIKFVRVEKKLKKYTAFALAAFFICMITLSSYTERNGTSRNAAEKAHVHYLLTDGSGLGQMPSELISATVEIPAIVDLKIPSGGFQKRQVIKNRSASAYFVQYSASFLNLLIEKRKTDLFYSFFFFP